MFPLTLTPIFSLLPDLPIFNAVRCRMVVLCFRRELATQDAIYFSIRPLWAQAIAEKSQGSAKTSAGCYPRHPRMTKVRKYIIQSVSAFAGPAKRARKQLDSWWIN